MPQLTFFVICFWIPPVIMCASLILFVPCFFLSWKRIAHVSTVLKTQFRQALGCRSSFLSGSFAPRAHVCPHGSYLGVDSSVPGLFTPRTPRAYILRQFFWWGQKKMFPFKTFPPFLLLKGLQSNHLFLSEPHTPLGDFPLFLPDSPALVGKSLGSCVQNMWQLSQIFATTYSGP